MYDHLTDAENALLAHITNYVDHERSTKDDGRAESAMFGSGDTLKTKAMEVIMESAAKLEIVSRPQYFSSGASTGSSLLDDVADLTVSR